MKLLVDKKSQKLGSFECIDLILFSANGECLGWVSDINDIVTLTF